MYSPLSDLQKMFYSPEFVVFRVDINGKEYLGRPNTIPYHYDPGAKQKVTFITYSSVQSFMAGYISDEIQVTSADLKGIEAIDTVSSEPLRKILAACNNIENIPVQANVGIILRNVVPMLVTLSGAMEEYEQAHNLIRFETVYEDIEDLMKECAKCPLDLHESRRSSMIRNLKERVSFDVTRLIDLSAQYSSAQPIAAAVGS